MATISIKQDGKWIAISSSDPIPTYQPSLPFSYAVVRQTTTPQQVNDYLNVSDIVDAGKGITRINFNVAASNDQYAAFAQTNGVPATSAGNDWRCPAFVTKADSTTSSVTVRSKPPNVNKGYADSNRVAVQLFSQESFDA